MAQFLNTWTLGGLMVGPILGSGIVLLPPLAYARLGDQASWLWLAVLVLGAGFAAVFIRLALKTKSDIGIASLVAREWGPVWGELASNYLTGAVIFGAVPVLVTGAHLWPRSLSFGLDPMILAAALLLLAFGLLMAGLTTVSRVTLVLSSATAVSLLAGSVVGFFSTPPVWPAPVWNPSEQGPVVLLLFWAIVGWEVIGSYSNQVRDPDKTIPLAGLVSLAAVTLVYLCTALALQTLPPNGAGVTAVLVPLFGAGADIAAGVLGGGLCLVTFLMFVGAVTKMTAQRARERRLPRWLGESDAGSEPRRATLALAATSSLFLFSVGAGWLTVESLVSVANLFFLGNALLGLAAAWKLLEQPLWRVLIATLAVVLALLLTQGLPWGWALVAVVTAATIAVDQLRRKPTF